MASDHNMKRFDQVDGLRGIACMLVIWRHVADAFAEIAGSGLWVQQVAQNFNVGLIGVLAFFAISGYVIPSSLRGARVGGVKQFLTRRFWRLYPPFWFAVLVTWLMDLHSFSPERLVWNITMIPSLGGETSAAGHFWTLEVELVFYLIVAALFLMIGKLGWKVIIPVYTLVGAWYVEWPIFPLEEHWRSIVLYLAVMFWGACCREIMQFDFGNWVRSTRVNLARAIGLGLASGLVLVRPLKSAYFAVIEGNASLLGFGASSSLAILLFLFWVILTPVHSTFLARFGRWTYSTYLLHAVVFYSVLWIIEKWGLSFLQGWHLMVYVLTLIVLCFGIGGLAYQWIELPSDRVGKRLSGKSR
ncbi:MAG: hypothetical protein CMI16_00550 [Opitutaceae bacterium]|nr:hypothetical protein [Opitutaceae bacterium]